MSTGKNKDLAAVMHLNNLHTAWLSLELEEEENRVCRKNRLWVKRWKRERSTKGAFSLLSKELLLQDKDSFRRYLRMTEACYVKILECIRPRIEKQNTVLRDAIPADEVLATVLRFLATGESYRSMEYSTRLSLAFISMTVPSVCQIIYEEMKGDYLQFPSSFAEWKSIAGKFNDCWQFPLCIGALDGKHIAFRASKSDGAFFHNYKGFDSIVLLAFVGNFKREHLATAKRNSWKP